MPRIYLDHNATSPILPAVADRMAEALRALIGNPSSVHREGQRARAAVEEARRQVAVAVGTTFTQVVFTSGATEANNLALHSLAAGLPAELAVATTVVEHPSVLASVDALERAGRRVVRLAVDGQGRLGPVDALVEHLLAERVGALSVMLANNEVGNLYAVAELAARLAPHGVKVHTDATQAVGKVAVDVGALGVELLSLSAHKCGGPKGVGALILAPGATLQPLLRGGHQERGRRGGTENVAGIVGAGLALELAVPAGLAAAGRVRELVGRLQAGIEGAVPGAVAQGDPAQRLPNTLNVRFPDVDGETLLMNLDLDGISVSAGSACSAGSMEPSHVILAMGVPASAARGSVRFSLGVSTSVAEIEHVVARLPSIVSRSRL